jgi:predicted SprT family Zn-dependent metalloprotease
MKTINQYNVSVFARELMNQHGLGDWVFQFDRAKRRAGLCTHRDKIISLSYIFVLRNDDGEIKECILHEIAHALAGPGIGHGPVWRQICRQIGCRPVRCYDSAKVDMPVGRYLAVCPGCQREFRRHRRPRCQRYCRRCGPERGLLRFS